MAKVDDQEMIENSIVMTNDIIRNFNAEQFLEDGFQTPIVLNSPRLSFVYDKMSYYTKELSQ